MRRSRFSENRIGGILEEVEAGWLSFRRENAGTTALQRISTVNYGINEWYGI